MINMFVLLALFALFLPAPWQQQQLAHNRFFLFLVGGAIEASGTVRPEFPLLGRCPSS